jgi:hypothetical protein
MVLFCVFAAFLPSALQNSVERSTLKAREGGGCNSEVKT